MAPARPTSDITSLTVTSAISSSSFSPSLSASTTVLHETDAPGSVAASSVTAVPAAATTALTSTPTFAGAGVPSAHAQNLGVKVLIGLLVAFVGLCLIAALVWFFVRRRWRVAEGTGVQRQWSLYQAAPLDDHEDDVDIAEELYGVRTGARGEANSKMSERESTLKSYKRTRSRSSLGSFHAPGIEQEEAYAMFNTSSTTLDRYAPPGIDDPPAPPSRHRSTQSTSSIERGLGNSLDTVKGERRRSLLDDVSRYPSVTSTSSSSAGAGRRMSRVSDGFDPFGDGVPTNSPPIPTEHPPISGPSRNLQG